MALVETMTPRELRSAVLGALRASAAWASVSAIPADVLALEPDPAVGGAPSVAVVRSAYVRPDGRTVSPPGDVHAVSDLVIRLYRRTPAAGRSDGYDGALDAGHAVAMVLLQSVPALRATSPTISTAIEGEWVRVDVEVQVRHRVPRLEG